MSKISCFLSIILIGCMGIGIWSNLIYPFNPIATLLILGIVVWVIVKHKQLKTLNWLRLMHHEKKLTFLIVIAILIIQVIIVSTFKASVYHDPFRVLYQADLLSHNQFNWKMSTYFDHYPNNVSLVAILACWLKFTQLFGISTNWAVHILCILTIDILIILLIQIVRKIAQNKSFELFVAIFFLITPFAYTYLLQVFYSDILLLLSVCSIILGILSWQNSSIIKKIGLTFLIVIFSLFGMLVKPSIIVIVLAVGLTLILFLIFKKEKFLLIPTIAIFIGIGGGMFIQNQIEHQVQFIPEKQYQLPVTSWIYMGLNPRTNGTYNNQDIQQIESFSVKTRSAKTVKLISNRVKKLGISGLFAQIISKVTVCENAGSVQGAYMGGNYEAPKWFLEWQVVLSLIASVIFRSIFILMMIIIIKKAYYHQFNDDWQTILFQLMTLGFIAFYSLVWESECRYGLILIPLLMILLFIPSKTKTIKQPVIRKVNVIELVFYIMIGGFLIFNGITRNISKDVNFFTDVITSQNSQLSRKYDAVKTEMKPSDIITEKVNVPVSVNYFAMQIPVKSGIKVELRNLTTNKQIHLIKKGDIVYYHDWLARGKYEIKVTNPTSKVQTCWVVNPQTYKLANHKIKSSLGIKNGYLIYAFENRFKVK